MLVHREALRRNIERHTPDSLPVPGTNTDCRVWIQTYSGQRKARWRASCIRIELC